MCAGQKYITPLNLVRLGLATAQTKQIFKAPKFNSAFKLLTTQEIDSLYTQLKTELTSNDPYGPFNALIFFVGRNAAQELARSTGTCPYRPLPRTVDQVEPDEEVMTMSNKRNRLR